LKVFVGCCDDEPGTFEVLVVGNLLLEPKSLLLETCEDELLGSDFLLVVVLGDLLLETGEEGLTGLDVLLDVAVGVLEEVLAFAELELVAVAVQPPVIDGTASTPLPIATMLVPQFAACARSTLALSWSYTTGSHQHSKGILGQRCLLYADRMNESTVRTMD
jgi:hypothetical protein